VNGRCGFERLRNDGSKSREPSQSLEMVDLFLKYILGVCLLGVRCIGGLHRVNTPTTSLGAAVSNV
jgi:hypothetical protein